MITGSPEPDWEADWDYADGETYAAGAYVSSIRLDPAGFRCQVCGPNLGAQHLAFGGFRPFTLADDNSDLSGATQYFGRVLAEESRGDDY